MIRGHKNFLPPAPLIMGFTFLFKLVRAELLPCNLRAHCAKCAHYCFVQSHQAVLYTLSALPFLADDQASQPLCPAASSSVLLVSSSSLLTLVCCRTRRA